MSGKNNRKTALFNELGKKELGKKRVTSNSP